MRYHWGMGIGHPYSHADGTSTTLMRSDSTEIHAASSQPTQQSQSSTKHKAGAHTNDPDNKVDESDRDSEYLSDPELDLGGVGSGPLGTEAGPDSESEAESVAEDYVDLDGWDDFDLGALNGYEF